MTLLAQIEALYGDSAGTDFSGFGAERAPFWLHPRIWESETLIGVKQYNRVLSAPVSGRTL